MQHRTCVFPRRITCSHLLIILVLLGAAVVASQVLARPDRGSARSATSMYQENNAKLVYSPAWKAVRNAKCFNGLMRKRSAAGSVTAAFTGTGVSVYVTKGPAYGIMNVTLDGVAQKSVSLYAAAKPTGGRPSPGPAWPTERTHSSWHGPARRSQPPRARRSTSMLSASRAG